jgi:hypothetical protein
MKEYKTPALDSYKSEDIAEIMGPAQTDYNHVADGTQYMLLMLPVIGQKANNFRPFQKVRRFMRRLAK